MGEAQSALGRKDLANAGSAQNQALNADAQGRAALAEMQRSIQAGSRQAARKIRWAAPPPLGNTGIKIPGPTIWRGRAPFWKNCAAARRDEPAPGRTRLSRPAAEGVLSSPFDRLR